MKILEVTTLFPRWAGDGRGPIILLIARALQKEGAEVLVISQHGPKSTSRENIDGVTVFRPRYMWPAKYEILQETGGGLPAAWEKKPVSRLLFPLLLIAQMSAILRFAKHYDVIHAQFTIPAMAATLTKPFHRKPIVTTVRGSDIYRIPKFTFGKLFNRIALGGSDKITVMSKDLQQATVALGIPESKFEYLPPPIDLERFQSAEWKDREPLILYIASLIPRKGPRFLIEAFKKIEQRFPNYRLIMIGSGPEEGMLKELVTQLDIREKVQFIPSQTQEQVADWLRRASLFVLPSLEEALGMVAVEALASGTPVVGSRVGGIPEVITPETGRLVTPGDADELAITISSLLESPEVLEQMSKNARPWVEANFYSHEQNARHLLRIFDALAKT